MKRKMMKLSMLSVVSLVLALSALTGCTSNTNTEQTVVTPEVVVTKEEVVEAEEIDMTFKGALVSIPAGTFTMGIDSDNPNDPTSKGVSPAHEVTLDAFEMGATEVTNQQYADYLNAALQMGQISVENFDVGSGWMMTRIEHPYPAYQVVGTDTEEYANMPYITLSPAPSLGMSKASEPSIAQCMIIYNSDYDYFQVRDFYEDYPVNFVTWYGAYAFAEFYGLSLPTEAQWEYAAKGGQDLVYPTDDGTIDYTKVNYGGTAYNHGLPWPAGTTQGTPLPEGYLGYPTASVTENNMFPPNPFGLYNMGGNMIEWVLDWYSPSYYQECFVEGTVVNPVNTVGEEVALEEQFNPDQIFSYPFDTKAARSSGYNFNAGTVLTTHRWSIPAARANDHFGFRIAKNN